MLPTGNIARMVKAEAEGMGLCLNFRQCKRIAIKAIRIAEREDDRLFHLQLKTSDDYRSTSYSDPTGEQAVMNILRSLLADTSAVA